MERFIRGDVLNCQFIHYHPNYYLFSGDNFQSCSRQGGPLFTYPKVKIAVHSIAILSDNKLLVEDAKSFLHILDLRNGTVLASKKTPTQFSSTRRFAVSPNGENAFRISRRGEKTYLEIIDLLDLNYRKLPYIPTLHHIADMVFKNGELLVLESSVDNNGTCLNCVKAVLINGNVCKSSLLYQWTGKYCGKFFDGEYVWDNGNNIRNLKTGLSFNLLEHSEVVLPEKFVVLSHIYYPDQELLQLINGDSNIFVDCKKRKTIARYYLDPNGIAFGGFYTENKFWFGQPNGISSKAFPIIESH